MKMNRIQFQKGLSLDDVHDTYGDQAKCEAILVKDRWALRRIEWVIV
jgi:hypothetical protein